MFVSFEIALDVLLLEITSKTIATLTLQIPFLWLHMNYNPRIIGHPFGWNIDERTSNESQVLKDLSLLHGQKILFLKSYITVANKVFLHLLL